MLRAAMASGVSPCGSFEVLGPAPRPGQQQLSLSFRRLSKWFKGTGAAYSLSAAA